MRDDGDFGIYLDFVENSVQKHDHLEVELLFCLKGCLKAQIGRQLFCFRENDIVVINSREVHELCLSDEGMICRILIDYDMLIKEAGSGCVEFYCNSKEHRGQSYEDLTEILEALVEEYSLGMILNFRKKELFYRLLVCLMNRYVREYRTRNEALLEDQIMKKTLAYMSQNLGKRLSLKDAASINFMSESSFSKYFKRRMGINFIDYVHRMRYTRAQQELIYTDKSMTEIALDCGYSNASVFTKSFRAIAKCSPSEFRKNNHVFSATQRNYMENKKRLPDMGLKEPFAALAGSTSPKALQALTQMRQRSAGNKYPCRKFLLDASIYKENEHVWNECINAGTAAELLSAKLQEHILLLREALGFKYVRITNIFAWEMKLRKNSDDDELNFENVDTVLDFIVSHGMHPMIEAGDKPRRAIRAIGDLLFFEDDGVVFHSFEEMKHIYEKFISHVILRYGADEAEQWIFENWYDGRSERSKVSYDYLDTFDTIYEIVKKRLPKAKIGGCGIELGGQMPDFIMKWKNQKHQPDFISFCAFPYRRDASGLRLTAAMRSGDIHFLERELKNVMDCLKKASLDGIDLYLTEWNLSISDRNYFNDCCGKGALMLRTMKALTGMIKMGAFWYGSDVNTSYFDTREILFGGAGLISKDALRKPAFFALYFMRRLGRYLMDSEDGCIATTNGNGSYELVLFNYKHFNYTYYLKNEDEILAEDTKRIFENEDCLEVKFTIKNIPKGEYFYKTERVYPSHGNLLAQWLDLGNTQALSMTDFKYLKQICVPKVHIDKLQVSDNVLTAVQTLEPHEMCFIRIYPAGDICL